MNNDIRFLDLVPGSIGSVAFKRNAILGMTEEQKQEYVSQAANARMRAFINNYTYGMLSNGPIDPADAYAKARRDSWGDLDDGEVGTEIEYINIQIGQQDSLDYIAKIETRADFVGWTNPHFINMIKTIKTT